MMDAALWQQTADIALAHGVISVAADPAAYTNELVQQAQSKMGDLDNTGTGWTPEEVAPTEGGQ